jgi:hypothetical protein
MTGDKKWFSSLTPVKEKMYITFGDNGRARVISEGVVHVSDKVTLKRVVLVEIGPEGWTPTQQPPEFTPSLRLSTLSPYYYSCEER